MKLSLILLFSLIAAQSYSQKLKFVVNETDKFTKEKRLETNWCALKPTLTAPLSVKLRSVGQHCFITLSGANYGANVIGQDATAVFLLDNDSTIEVGSTGIQDYEITDYGKAFKHQYSIGSDDLRVLADHLVKSVRKVDSDTYHDFDIPKGKGANNFNELVIMFLAEYDKK